jgi:hypothetical protein
MPPQFGQVIVDCKISRGIPASAVLTANDKTCVGYSSKQACNHDFATIAHAADTAKAYGASHVRFGSRGDICAAKRHVRFAPESGHSAWVVFG